MCLPVGRPGRLRFGEFAAAAAVVATIALGATSAAQSPGDEYAPPVAVALHADPVRCNEANFGPTVTAAQPDIAAQCAAALAGGRALLLTWQVGACPQRICLNPVAYVPFDATRPFYAQLPADARAAIIGLASLGTRRCLTLRALAQPASTIYSAESNLACRPHAGDDVDDAQGTRSTVRVLNVPPQKQMGPGPNATHAPR